MTHVPRSFMVHFSPRFSQWGDMHEPALALSDDRSFTGLKGPRVLSDKQLGGDTEVIGSTGACLRA
jgi:hypothetical protein